MNDPSLLTHIQHNVITQRKHFEVYNEALFHYYATLTDGLLSHLSRSPDVTSRGEPHSLKPREIAPASFRKELGILCGGFRNWAIHYRSGVQQGPILGGKTVEQIANAC